MANYYWKGFVKATPTKASTLPYAVHEYDVMISKMPVNKEILLCKACPAQGTYKVPILLNNFRFYVNDCDTFSGCPVTTECVVDFLNPDTADETNSNIGGDVAITSATAKMYYRIFNKYSEVELGQYFLDKIAECSGSKSLDGPPFCQAMNEIEFRKLDL